MHKGLASLDKLLILETLKNLDDAAADAIKNKQYLMFYGD